MAGDDFFGFTPSLSESYRVASTTSRGGGGMDFGGLTIKEHYPAIMREDPDSLRESSQGWTKVESLMSSTGSSLTSAGNGLRSDWKSEAGDAFLLKVGATSASLDEWSAVAAQNASALSTLAQAVQTAKTDMQALWNEFQAKAAELKAQEESRPSPAEDLRDIGEWFGANRLEDNLKEFTQRSMSEVVEPLSQAYTMASVALGTGSTFQGPKNAKRPSMGAMGGGAPGAPGGAPASPGGAPASPGGAAPAHPGAAPGGGAAARNAAIKARNEKIAARNAAIKAKNKIIAKKNAAIKAKNKIIAAQNAAIKAKNKIIAAQNAAIKAQNAIIAQQNALIAAHNAQIAALNAQIAAVNAMLAALAAAAPVPAGVAGGPAPEAPTLPPGALAPPVAPSGGGGLPVLPPGAAAAASGAGIGPRPGAPALPSGFNGMGAPPAPPGAPPAAGLPPGLQGRSGGPMAPPGMPAQPGAVAPPMLPGRGGVPGGPGSPPGVPAQPGWGPGSPPARPGQPGHAGGAGAPALPGRGGGTGQAGFPGSMAPASPGATGTPRSLQGIRWTIGKPGLPFGEPAISAPPGLSGRLQPGRVGAPETAETMRQALRSGLDGRGLSEARPGARPSLGSSGRPGAGSSTPTPTQHPSRNGDASVQRADLEWIGDEELFTTDQKARAVIEPPQYRGPIKRPGPALGASH